MKNKLRILPAFIILSWIIMLLVTGIGYRLFFQEERNLRIHDLENQLNTIQKLDEYHSALPRVGASRALIAICVGKKFYVPQGNEDFFPTLIKNLQEDGWKVDDSELHGRIPSLSAQKGIYKIVIGALFKNAQYNWKATICYDDIFEKLSW